MLPSASNLATVQATYLAEMDRGAAAPTRKGNTVNLLLQSSEGSAISNLTANQGLYKGMSQSETSTTQH